MYTRSVHSGLALDTRGRDLRIPSSMIGFAGPHVETYKRLVYTQPVVVQVAENLLALSFFSGNCLNRSFEGNQGKNR